MRWARRATWWSGHSFGIKAGFMVTLLIAESKLRMDRAGAGARDYVTYPVGQIVGDMHGGLTVRQVRYDMLAGFADAADRLRQLLPTHSLNCASLSGAESL